MKSDWLSSYRQVSPNHHRDYRDDKGRLPRDEQAQTLNMTREAHDMT